VDTSHAGRWPADGRTARKPSVGGTPDAPKGVSGTRTSKACRYNAKNGPKGGFRCHFRPGSEMVPRRPVSHAETTKKHAATMLATFRVPYLVRQKGRLASRPWT